MEEDQTVSVAKGVFIFKNGIKAASNKPKSKEKVGTSLHLLSKNPWYKSYETLWNSIEEQIDALNNEMFSSVLQNLVGFAGVAYKFDVNEVPTAALLTGINMPDHKAQFTSLVKQLKDNVTEHVACLYAQDCQNIKYLVDNMINQFVNEDRCGSDEDELEVLDKPKRIKKSMFCLPLLQGWYEELYLSENPRTEIKKERCKNKKKVLVVIISDFEAFNPEVLQRFILIANAYINVLPIVIVLGIATSLSTLHTTLPYHVSSKICVQVFHSKSSTEYLNKVLEDVFFTLDCPFQLGGKVFNLFIDIFLFYDFSVSGFIQNIKYAMLEHFSYGNAMSLCSESKKEIKQQIKKFTNEDCENTRRLLSFRKLVESESYEYRIKLLTDDEYFKEVLEEEVFKLRKYIRRLHIFVKALWILVCDLPKTPLGKHLREVYSVATSQNITKIQEYKECFQLLNFQSKAELCFKLERVIENVSSVVNFSYTKPNKLQEFVINLKQYLKEIDEESNEEMDVEILTDIANTEEPQISGQMDRKQLKEKLLGMSKQTTKSLNRYEQLREAVLTYMSNTFEMYLTEPYSMYFHEICFFNDMSIRSHIIGEHRAAIHAGLNNPHYYLDCECCHFPETAIRSWMPDICIAYKLHLECGKLINLYDWLQAFVSIIDPCDDDEDDATRIIKPELQARFTQAVQELEFLGFIKSSKKKADHVMRTTWGG